MALIKIKELNNGTSGEYWVAETHNNMMIKKTMVVMSLFKDKATREAGKGFLERTRLEPVDGVYLTGEQVYTAIKESKLETLPAILEEKDDEGNIVVEGAEEVTVELNWFADAIDA